MTLKLKIKYIEWEGEGYYVPALRIKDSVTQWYWLRADNLKDHPNAKYFSEPKDIEIE